MRFPPELKGASKPLQTPFKGCQILSGLSENCPGHWDQRLMPAFSITALVVCLKLYKHRFQSNMPFSISNFGRRFRTLRTPRLGITLHASTRKEMPMSPEVRRVKERYCHTNVTPVWLLIFWRLVRGIAQGDYAIAFQLLPAHLPAGVTPPEITEAAAVPALHKLT